MLLAGALFALFMTGFWLYCLTDAIVTPAAECRGLGSSSAEPAEPRGPDDDPEFLRALDRAIRGNSQAGGEV